MSTIAAITDIANHAMTEPRVSLEFASKWFDWAGLALIAGTVVVLVSTIVIVWLGIEKEHHWDLLRKASNEKVAVLDSETAKANAEAARLRLELDREIQKRAQRLLTEDQKRAMLTELTGKMPTIALVIQYDLETRAFAIQFMSIFQDAGAKPLYVPEPPREDKWYAPAGLMMYSPLGQNEEQLKDDPLYRALKAANLFGGTTSQPFVSPELRGPVPAVIPGYTGHVLYIGQKSPF